MPQSRAAARALDALPPAVPGAPVHASDHLCQGLAFIRRASSVGPDLAQVRERVADIRRGVIGEGGAEREILIVVFHGRPAPFGLGFPTALPLVAIGRGELASHSVSHGKDGYETDGPFRTINLWWAGQEHRLSLDFLEQVPIATLWAMPTAIVHAPHAPPQPHEDAYGSGGAGDGAVPVTAPKAASDILRRTLHASGREADPFAELRQSLKQRRSRGPLSVGGLFSLPGMGSLFRYVIWGALALFLLSAILRGGSVIAWIIIIAVGLFIGWVLGPLLPALGESEGETASVPARPRGPGVLDNFLGWLAWKNPLGSMQRQMDARIQQVKRLAANGQLDEALSFAIGIGDGEQKRNRPRRYPRQLPSARAQLDFDVEPEDFETPVLSGSQSWQMRQTYEKLATKLESDGDYRRAAFIRSQLLDQQEAAVKLLEQGGLLDEAAQLALAAKVDPVLTIRLLYLTGKKDAALAMARRAACFEQLAQATHGKDAEFHVYVIKAWSDALIESGQPLRALQVTDELAGELGANPTLLELRRGWLARAVEIEETAGFAAESMARSFLVGKLLDAAALADFPRILPQGGDPLLRHAMAVLRARTLDGDSADDLLALLNLLHRLAAPKSPEQAGFWGNYGAALLEVLAGGLLRKASRRLDPSDMGQLTQLLKMAGHRVLERDLGKLQKLHRAEGPVKRVWTLPEANVTQSPALAGCILGTGALVVWRESEILELMDASGAVLWRQAVSDVVGLVAVGGGANVLILQSQQDGLTRITRFDTMRRTLHPIGTLELLAHHDVTSEMEWLVQVGHQIGALDLAALCSQQGRFEFLWSCALTDRLRAVAFLHGIGTSSWITIDVSPDRFGLVELWQLEGSGRLNVMICSVASTGNGVGGMSPRGWVWRDSAEYRRFEALRAGHVTMWTTDWSEEQEAEARRKAQKRASSEGAEGVNWFVPCDFGRAAIIAPDAAANAGVEVRTIIRCAGDVGRDFALVHDRTVELHCLARAAVPPADSAAARQKKRGTPHGKVMLADQFGRLFLVDPETARVTVM